MNVKEYLEITGISIAKFARACDINENTMNTYFHEKAEPSLKNALRMKRETLGVIKLESLVLERNEKK